MIIKIQSIKRELLISIFFLSLMACKTSQDNKNSYFIEYEVPYIYEVPQEIKGVYKSTSSGSTIEILKFSKDGTVIVAFMEKSKSDNYDYFTTEWCKSRIGKFPVFQSKYEVTDNIIKFETKSKGNELNSIFEGVILSNSLVLNKSFANSTRISPLGGGGRVYTKYK